MFSYISAGKHMKQSATLVLIYVDDVKTIIKSFMYVLTHMDMYKWKNIRIKKLYFSEQMKHFLDKKELVLFEISFSDFF